MRQGRQELLFQPIAAFGFGTRGALTREQALPRFLRVQLLRDVGGHQNVHARNGLRGDLPFHLRNGTVPLQEL